MGTKRGRLITEKVGPCRPNNAFDIVRCNGMPLRDFK